MTPCISKFQPELAKNEPGLCPFSAHLLYPLDRRVWTPDCGLLRRGTQESACGDLLYRRSIDAARLNQRQPDHQALALLATFPCWRIRMALPKGARTPMSVP